MVVPREPLEAVDQRRGVVAVGGTEVGGPGARLEQIVGRAVDQISTEREDAATPGVDLGLVQGDHALVVAQVSLQVGGDEQDAFVREAGDLAVPDVVERSSLARGSHGLR